MSQIIPRHYFASARIGIHERDGQTLLVIPVPVARLSHLPDQAGAEVIGVNATIFTEHGAEALSLAPYAEQHVPGLGDVSVWAAPLPERQATEGGQFAFTVRTDG